jgi:hypothetical protein
MEKEIVYIVFVKPNKMIQQCLSVYSAHKTNDGAIKASREFILTYPDGYYEIRNFNLKK